MVLLPASQIAIDRCAAVAVTLDLAICDFCTMLLTSRGNLGRIGEPIPDTETNPAVNPFRRLEERL